MSKEELKKAQAAVQVARSNVAAAEIRCKETAAEIEAIAAERAALPFNEAKIREHISAERAAEVKREVAERMLETAKSVLAAAEAAAAAAAWNAKHDELRTLAENLKKVLLTDYQLHVQALAAILAQLSAFDCEWISFYHETNRSPFADMMTIVHPNDVARIRDLQDMTLQGLDGRQLWPVDPPRLRRDDIAEALDLSIG